MKVTEKSKEGSLNMSGHKGLDKWFKQDWVDIGSKKKGGGFAKCGRSKQKKTLKENILSVFQELKLTE